MDADICCLAYLPKKILKSDSNLQSYSKCYSGTLFWLTVLRARCIECIYKVVQQHNLGEVANSIPRFVYRNFIVTTVKESLKLIHVWQSYARNTKGIFLWLTVYLQNVIFVLIFVQYVSSDTPKNAPVDADTSCSSGIHVQGRNFGLKVRVPIQKENEAPLVQRRKWKRIGRKYPASSTLGSGRALRALQAPKMVLL